MDNLTRAEKVPATWWTTRVADYLDKDEFLGALCARGLRQGARGVSRGRVLRHHGDRRPLHGGEQLPLHALRAYVEACLEQGHAALCTHRPAATVPRPHCARSASSSDPLSIGWYSRFLFDQVVRRRLPALGPSAAESSASATLQRVRPREALQGPHSVGGVSTTSTSSAPRAP